MKIEYFVFFILWLQQTHSFLTITNYVSTSSFSNMNYNSAFQMNNGQEGYIGLLQNGVQLINKYNLSGASAVLQGSYVVSGTNTNGILVYNDYLIVYYQYSTTLAKMNKTSYAQLGTFTLSNQNIMSLVYLPTKNIVLYTTSSGVFGYITDFLNTNVMTPIISGLSGTLTLKSSPNQNYATILAGNTKQILIYSLTTYSLVANLTMSFSSWTDMYPACWHPDSTKLYVAPKNQGIFYIIDLSNAYAMTNKTFAAQNNMTVYQMAYSSIQNAMIFVNYYNSLNNVTVFTFSITTSTILRQQGFYYSDMITGVQFDFQKLMYYSAWSVNYVYFYSFNLCTISQYYSTLNASCTACTASCSICSQSGCASAPSPSSNVTANSSNYTNSSVSNSSAVNYTANFTSNSSVVNSSFLLNTTTNSTSNNSSSFVLNTTANSTANNSIFTNSTSNLTGNSSFILNLTNSTNFVNISNSSLTITSLYQNGLSESQLKNYESVLSNTLGNSVFAMMNKIPGSRRIFKPIFAFFVSFDDIWLYVYHPRQYNRVIQTIFLTTKELQNQKWSILPYRKIWSFLGINILTIQALFNEKQPYTNWKFIQIQGNGSGFIYNASNFLFSNVFLMILCYLVFRMVFFLLFNLKISVIFRPFSLWFFLLIMIGDGNIQYLSYLFGFQLTHFFSLSYISKFSSACILILFYFLFIFCICSFLFIKNFYGKLTKYLFDNANTSSYGASYLFAQIGLRNVVLGLVHSVVRESFYTEIVWLLILIQIIFFGFSVFLLSKTNSYILKLKTSILLITTMVRVLMIFTFTIDRFQGQILYFYQNIHFILILIYVGLAGSSILYEITNITYELSHLLCNISNKFQNKKYINLIENNLPRQIKTKGKTIFVKKMFGAQLKVHQKKIVKISIPGDERAISNFNDFLKKKNLTSKIPSPQKSSKVYSLKLKSSHNENNKSQLNQLQINQQMSKIQLKRFKIKANFRQKNHIKVNFFPKKE